MGRGVVCFGEVLLRLNAPGREVLLQTGHLDVHVGGAEANVAVSLATFGHSAAVVSVLPDNPLGNAARAALRRFGVGTDHVRLVEDGRLGLYFMSTGAGHRPSQIVYDRRDSAFALCPPDLIDWAVATQGAQWLHVSGITPALGPGPAAAALRAVRVARDQGLLVSFDCNYRAQLWQAWKSDPARSLRELLEHADLAFADARVLALILQQDAARFASPNRFRDAAEQAFAAFPQLQHIATTIRTEHSVDRHEMSAVMASRGEVCSTRTYSLEGIVDRIGTGDAFAAGILHGRLSGLEAQDTLDFALAAACLKHSIPGDVNLATVTDVQHLLADRGFAVRR
jgi:2-dehydro-3-deoxygluconokinase